MDPIYYLGEIGYSSEIGLVFLTNNTIRGDTGGKIEIGGRARGIDDFDAARISLTRRKRDKLAHRRYDKSILFHGVIIS